MRNKISRYSDIIDLPHHQSERRPHMSVYNRAAQFAPFAALVGYDEMVQDTADYRLLDQRIILSEDEKNDLDEKLKVLLEHLNQKPMVRVIYFESSADSVKGRYVEHQGEIKKIEEHPNTLIFVDGKRILVENIIDMNSDLCD